MKRRTEKLLNYVSIGVSVGLLFFTSLLLLAEPSPADRTEYQCPAEVVQP